MEVSKRGDSRQHDGERKHRGRGEETSYNDKRRRSKESDDFNRNLSKGREDSGPRNQRGREHADTKADTGVTSSATSSEESERDDDSRKFRRHRSRKGDRAASHKSRGRQSEKRKRSRAGDSSESDDSSDTDAFSSSSQRSDSSEDRKRRRRSRSETRKDDERRRKKKHRSKEKEIDKEEKKRRKMKEEKKRRKKERAEKLAKGPITSTWGKYGILKEIDMWNKRPEFSAWLAEVKKVNLETLSTWEEKQMFKEYMEDYNTATFPSKKYYNLDIYHRRKVFKAREKGLKAAAKTERTEFNDEEQRRQELRREREQQKEAEVDALKKAILASGQAQAMREQAQLREEMQYQYRLGNYEAAAALQRRLDPDAVMGK